MKLTVVVPTLNEATHLAAALESIPKGVELVVSDGGSTDETAAISARYGARIVAGDKGRAVQMNRGAAIARGDVLLFLHADCTLGTNAASAIEAALADDDVVGGSFRMIVRDGGRALRWVAATANARARYLKTPYGDQGLFVRRSDFDALGGFPETPFMEDVGFVRALKRRGKLVCLKEPVTTGTRHWQRLGPLSTTLLNWSMVTLYLLGVPAERLEPHYRRWRRPASTKKPAPLRDPSVTP
jgi:rSAM/selenodomain-associated transferase 2